MYLLNIEIKSEWNKLQNSNIEAISIEVDVDDELSCQNMVDQVVEKFQKIALNW